MLNRKIEGVVFMDWKTKKAFRKSLLDVAPIRWLSVLTAVLTGMWNFDDLKPFLW